MAKKLTPVMKQHAAAKNEHPDCVIFFRLGDFYEMFGDDAVLVSELLDLTLTSRNKGKPDEIPMAGLPHHAAHSYIARLLALGRKVAICEQMADPSTVKGIVPREVVRVLTPGTWNAEGQVQSGANNWLCAIEPHRKGVGVALLDLSTAELMAAVVPDISSALAEIARAAPSEIILGEGPEAMTMKGVLSELVSDAQVRIEGKQDVPDVKRVMKGIDIGAAEPLALAAAARAMNFALNCYRGKVFPVWRVAVWNPSGVLGLDRAAQRHLELVESSVGEKKATLLHVIDRTSSPGGARLLRRRLLTPLTDVKGIVQRQEQLESFIKHKKVRAEVIQALGSTGDLERLVVRGAQGEANPRDLGNIRRGLTSAAGVVKALQSVSASARKVILRNNLRVDLVEDLRETLEESLVERPPAQAKEGAIFKTGFDEELDSLSELRLNGSSRMTALEQSLKEKTGISNLRVRFNRVFGWYVEVSRSQTSRAPKDWRRKQTVANGERFTLDELDELAEVVQSAEAQFRTRELLLLAELGERLSEAAERVHRLTALLSEIDVAVSLAEVAIEFDYCRPVVDDSDVLEIVDGRHAVVERLAAAGRFVPNDVQLKVRKDHLWLISGPNMAGKSTFLRQIALTIVLAQMGSFVPAKSAKIGMVDRVLSRVGASDNLAGGESTFMVEMRETASILRLATSRSFVILDEVGRGTSTFDGLAIAWAVAEHLDEVVKCRCLFATHYHELAQFSEKSASASNHCVSAQQHEGKIVFMHRVALGAASRSYGVAVAQLAGLPEAVLARARGLLEALESGEGGQSKVQLGKLSGSQGEQTMPQVVSPEETAEERVLSVIGQLEPDRMTGLEALSLLHQLKNRLKKPDSSVN